jgi:hypothetical protein
MSSIKAILSTEKAGEKAGKSVDEILKKIDEKKNSKPKDDSKRFIRKGVIYFDENLGVTIERDSDTSGQRTDKKAKDTLKRH